MSNKAAMKAEPSRIVSEVDLATLAEGKLPPKVIDSISQVNLSVDEVVEWENSKPSFKLSIVNGEIQVDLHKRFHIKRGLAIIGGVITTLITLIHWGTDIYKVIASFFT